MSIADTILNSSTDVLSVSVNKTSVHHGSKATHVSARLNNGKTVEGWFTTEDKEAFGGVVFSQHKDIAALMLHKINSVMKGTSE